MNLSVIHVYDTKQNVNVSVFIVDLCST